jgi:hypothetical protein
MVMTLSRHPSGPARHPWSTPVTTAVSPTVSKCAPSSRINSTEPESTTSKSIVSVWCMENPAPGAYSINVQRIEPGGTTRSRKSATRPPLLIDGADGAA